VIRLFFAALIIATAVTPSPAPVETLMPIGGAVSPSPSPSPSP
jgi:hypothetical protein